MVGDELSIDFENLATDALGYEHVLGKLRCLREGMELYFDEKDRAFRETPPVERCFPHFQVDSIEVRKRWFRKMDLILRTKDPALLEGFPGGEVGCVTLQVKRRSRKDAERMASLVAYYKSEADLAASQDRLNDGLQSAE